MGYYFAIPILGFLAAFQSSIVPEFRYGNGQPDLILLAVFAWAIRAKIGESLFWAFIGGVVQDLLSVVPLGTSSLGLMLIVLIIHTIKDELYSFNWILRFIVLMSSSIAQKLITFAILWLIGLSINLIEALEYNLLPTLIFNVLLFLPMYWIMNWLQRFIPREEA